LKRAFIIGHSSALGAGDDAGTHVIADHTIPTCSAPAAEAPEERHRGAGSVSINRIITTEPSLTVSM
jgi:hypothetical protein